LYHREHIKKATASNGRFWPQEVKGGMYPKISLYKNFALLLAFHFNEFCTRFFNCPPKISSMVFIEIMTTAKEQIIFK